MTLDTPDTHTRTQSVYWPLVPSLRSWSIRGCLALALLGLAACGGGSGGDDGPSDQAKDACRRLGDALVEANRVAEGGATREEAQRVLDDLEALADDAGQAAEEDSAYFALANALDQLIAGLKSANAAQIDASTRTAARQCVDLFPDLVPQTTAPTTAPTTTAATEP